jgi:hypothetical protein
VLTISIAKLKPYDARLSGATTGEAHAKQVRAHVGQHSKEEAGAVIIDFARIESASASYLKRLINPFFAPPGGPESFPFEVSPIVTNVDYPDLKEELEDYLAGKGRVLIVADVRHHRPQFQQLLGRLDGAAAKTFDALRKLKKSTAAELYARHREQTSNQTAWNNRLVQLVDMRIARRSREGRFWIYEPTVKG